MHCVLVADGHAMLTVKTVVSYCIASVILRHSCCILKVFASSMVEGAGAYHVAKRLCDLEGRLPIDSVMSDSFQFWTTWRRQLCRLDSAAELTPQVGTA